MGLGYRTIRAVLAALVIGLAGVSPTLATDAPGGVVFDGVVTIHHLDADLGPQAGSVVNVSAYSGPNPFDAFQTLSGSTDATGTLVVSGVARRAGDGPQVLLFVHAQNDLEPALSVECWTIRTTLAGSDGVESAVRVEVTVTGSNKDGPSSIHCSAAEFSGVLRDPSGAAIGQIKLAFHEEGPSIETKTIQVTTASDGTFSASFPLIGPPPGLDPEPPTIVTVRTPTLQDVTYRAGACERTARVSVDTRVARTTAQWRQDDLPLTASVEVLDETCGITGGPQITLPPTDALSGGRATERGGGGPIAVLGSSVLAGFLLAALHASHRGGRRPRRSHDRVRL